MKHVLLVGLCIALAVHNTASQTDETTVVAPDATPAVTTAGGPTADGPTAGGPTPDDPTDDGGDTGPSETQDPNGTQPTNGAPSEDPDHTGDDGVTDPENGASSGAASLLTLGAALLYVYHAC